MGFSKAVLYHSHETSSKQVFLFQGENGDLKNRGIKVETNHVGLPSGEKQNPDLPDSSIGEGMDISIQVIFQITF